MIKRIHLKIYGRVQGVFFRSSARKKMEELKIKGWVRNCEDGGVETEVEGEEVAVEEYKTWCRTGPLMAKVKKMDEL